MGLSQFKTGRRLLFTLLLGLFALCPFLPTPPSASAAAGINQQINFQGRLLNSNGATVPDGFYNIEFKIYQDGDGQSAGDTTGSPAGTLKWTEDHLNTSSQGVTVVNGFLSVQLGSITAFGSNINWNQDTLWLSVNIGNTNATCTPFSSCSGDGEMLPMKRLSSTPYALNSGLLGGLASSQFVQLSQGLQADAGNSVNSIAINKTGTGGNFLNLQASGADAFTLNNSGDVIFGANANHTISVATAGAGVAGKSLTLTSGAAGTGGSALAGGSLVLQGGTGGGTNGNGGNVTIDAGVKNGTGADGTISIGTTTASAVSIAKSGVTTTVNGSLTVASNVNTTSGGYQVGGTTVIDSSKNISNVGTISTSSTINSQTISNAAVFTGTLSVQGASVTIGHSGVSDVTGNLKLDTTTGRMVVLQGLSPTGSGDATIQFPALAGGSTDTVCIQTANNCSIVSKSSGTQNFVTKWSNAGATTIGNSQIFDNGTGVSIGNNAVTGLFNVGASNQFQVSSTGAVTAVGLDSGTGLLQGTGGLTVSGAITLSSINTAGIVHATNTGVLSSSAVLLGTETSGSYVANLGTLTGLTTTGNSGAGSTPTLSVTYGSGANTAAQGNTSLSFTGAGNLTGSLSGTAGGGFTTTTLDVVSNPTFSGLITGSANTSALSLTGTPAPGTGITSLLRLGNAISGGDTSANGGTYLGLNAPGSGAGSTADLLNFQWNGNARMKLSSAGALTVASTFTVSSGGIAVTGNSTIAGTLSSLTGLTSSGSITFSGLNTAGVVHNSGTGLLSTSAVALGTDTSGNYLLGIGTLTGLTTTTTNAPGANLDLSVRYGSASSTAAQGNTALTFTGSGNLTGSLSGTAGGGFTTTTLDVVSNPTFSGLLTAAGGLTVNTGSTFTNASSTLNTAIAISDKPTGGSIGTAAATVDVATAFTVNQSSTNQTITIPNPTATTAGRVIYVSNIGSASFSMLSSTLNPGSTATLVWNGSAWTYGGADGASILNQTVSAQTASFWINGSGRSDTSFLTPAIERATAGTLSIGTTSNTTALTIGRSGITATVSGALTVTQLLTASSGLMVATGSTFTNASSTLNTAIGISDLPTGGNIGTAAATVDVATAFTINQTTGSQTITIPSPTVTTAGRIIYISNIGSANFTMLGSLFPAGASATLTWNGSAWKYAGSGGSAIENQNAADQTANFRVTGNGQLATLSATTGVNTGASAGTQRIDSSGNLVNIGNLTTSGASTFATTGATGFAFKPGTDNGTAFQVQNAGGASILVVDSTNRQLKVMENGGSTNYALIYYDTATSTANYTASAGTVAVGTGAGAISVVAGSSAAITITANAASTWKTTAGTLTLQSGTSSDLILNAGSSIVSVNGAGVLKLGSSAGDPATCTLGAIVYNSTTNVFRGCQGSSPAWATLSAATPTLQSSYTTSTGGTTPEIKLDSTRAGLDIQDADTSINGIIFAVRGTNVAGLGTALLSVNTNTNTVNIGNSDTSTTPLALDTDTDSTFNSGTTSNAGTVVNGAMFYSSTDHNFMCGTAGQWITCNGLLYSNTSASSAINTCTTACAAFSTNNSASIPANYCQAGRVVRISAKGVYSTAASATLQFGVYYGTDPTTRANDVLIGTASGAMSSGAAVSNQGWGVDFNVVCYSTTSMNGQGMATMATTATATNTSLMYNNGATTVATGTAKNFYIFPTWGTSASGDTLTAQQFIISGQ